MRKAALLALAAVLYAGAAWMVAPGFYDGFTPPSPYNFVCPPPQAGANLPPTSGHLDVKVIDGVSDANSAFTDDGQVVVGFLPGSFDVTGKTSITVDIKPVSPCPKPQGLHFSTNTYQITADAPLVKPATLVMTYSNLTTDPSFVYRADSVDGPWTNIGASPQARLYTIDVKTDTLSYFAAGFPSNALSNGGGPGGGGQQLLPWIVAALIAAVLLAGIPLTIVRRRAASRGGSDDEADA
jgi:hypothetical protein